MIGQWTFGISNKLDENIFIFFYEYDNTELKYVEFDAKLLSDKGNIDMYILESSKGNFHLISLDLISKEKLIMLQNWVTCDGDYSRMQDEELYFSGRSGFNVLRLGEKLNKKSPQFIKLIKCENNKNAKSLQHYKLYKRFCNIPELKEDRQNRFINLPTRIVIYKTKYKKESV